MASWGRGGRFALGLEEQEQDGVRGDGMGALWWCGGLLWVEFGGERLGRSRNGLERGPVGGRRITRYWRETRLCVELGMQVTEVVEVEVMSRLGECSGVW